MTSTASAVSGTWQIANLNSPVDGIKIRYGTCTTGSEKPKFGVLLLNGRSEWLEKYCDLPSDLELGASVLWASLDHRGQGGSDGIRAHVESYQEFAQDAAAVANAAFGTLPYVVLSHSMGGLIGLIAVIEGYLKPVAMVLSSPLFALPHAPLHRSIAKPLAQLISRSFWKNLSTGAKVKRETTFHKNPLTHSLSGFQKVIASPYPYCSPSFAWVAATFAACEQIYAPASLAKLNCPVLIITGSEESVVDSSVYGHWCSLVQKQPFAVELLRIAGGRHELLNEIPRLRNQAITQARAWFSKHLFQPS